MSFRDIPPGQLPNAPPGPYPASDVTTFDEFYDSGLFGVESRCLRYGSLGYAIVGECFLSFKRTSLMILRMVKARNNHLLFW